MFNTKLLDWQQNDLYFRKDAPGVDGGLDNDSMRWQSSLFDLTSSSLIIFWVDLDPNVQMIWVKSKVVKLF